MSITDEDDDLNRAIALSLESSKAEHESINNAIANTVESMKSARGLAGLDRRGMEAERLARLKQLKRERSISPPEIRPSKLSCVRETGVLLSSGAKLNMIVQPAVFGTRATSQGTDLNDTVAPDIQQSYAPPNNRRAPIVDGGINYRVPDADPGDIIYPFGTVKITWAFGYDRSGHDIKLEEVLETDTLNVAVLSAYQWDMDWLFGKLKSTTRDVPPKCVFVMQAKEDELRKRIIADTRDIPWLKICFPSMFGQIHCMHSKLMLLFHAQKLRVVVPSANLRNFDWGETGEMENSVFLIDLPRLKEGSKQSENDLTSFGRELTYFIRKQEWPDDVQKALLKFDFSATTKMAFVHTVGGSATGAEADRTGLPGLAQAVRRLDLHVSKVKLDFAASSIGSLSDDQLSLLLAAAKGESLLAQISKTSVEKQKSFFSQKKRDGEVSASISPRNHINLYFPTHETVKDSTAGSTGTICLARRWFEKDTFPRSVFRDYRSKRSGLLSHNKLIYARGHRAASDSSMVESINWLYLGSANMSESAWGKITRDKKSRELRINCRNWECGVLLPITSTVTEAQTHEANDVDTEIDSETDSETSGVAGDAPTRHAGNANSAEVSMDRAATPTVKEVFVNVRQRYALPDMSIFSRLLEPPFHVPGEVYGEREPWYFGEVDD